MPIISFNEMLSKAEKGNYAVGYFESWNMESLQAVADAAEATCSPVILGFSGIYLHHPERVVRDHLSSYAKMGNDICRQISVPSCLIFNESPHIGYVLKAIELDFGIVMFADDTIGYEDQIECVSQVVNKVHRTIIHTKSLAPVWTAIYLSLEG